MSKSYEFPAGFLWGAATSAYQIEGSPLADGAGPSIWHRFVRTPGLVQRRPHRRRGLRPLPAHEGRRRPDEASSGSTPIASASPGRASCPSGRGAVNEGGMDFYERLVDTLLENGIEPLATLFHWDLPVALDDRGGWLNPDVADWFADYASVDVPAPRRPGEEMDHAQRALGRDRRRLSARRARARPQESLRGADRGAPPVARAWQGGRGPIAPKAGTRSAWSSTSRPSMPASDKRRRRRRGARAPTPT